MSSVHSRRSYPGMRGTKRWYSASIRLLLREHHHRGPPCTRQRLSQPLITIGEAERVRRRRRNPAYRALEDCQAPHPHLQGRTFVLEGSSWLCRHPSTTTARLAKKDGPACGLTGSSRLRADLHQTGSAARDPMQSAASLNFSWTAAYPLIASWHHRYYGDLTSGATARPRGCTVRRRTILLSFRCPLHGSQGVSHSCSTTLSFCVACSSEVWSSW